MQNILPIWQSLSNVRKAIVVGATIAVFLAVLAMSRLVTQPRMTLLYSGLDPAVAGEVIQSLQQRSVPFEVQGTSILVAADSRDQLRLSLATEGLPAATGQGYELLDGLSGFGTTSQMFDAAYLRAKEGELARTIVSSPNIANARVHIATGSDTPFRPDLSASASVHITARSGSIERAQVQAIRHLVASAVAGLAPEAVSVIDSRIGLLSDDSDLVSAERDKDRSDLLRDRVLRLVEARVGRGNAVVEVGLETITESESITERVFDPESRFVISSDSEERSDQSENAGPGSVTVASNLPDGDAAGTESETRQTAETRERLNYEVSQTTREITKAPGAIKRLTVAVMVNGSLQTDAQGVQTLVPIPEEELAVLRDLVASAVGFDDSRGDVITLKSLSFEPVQSVGSPPVEQGWLTGQLDMMRLVQLGILGLVTLILGLFVLRPLLMPGRRTTIEALPRPSDGPAQASELPVLNGTIEPDIGEDYAMLATRDTRSDVLSKEDAVARLKTLIDERRGETVEVLRSWLDEPRTEDAR